MFIAHLLENLNVALGIFGITDIFLSMVLLGEEQELLQFNG